MARDKICGAYVLTHVQSGHLYIGSTGDLHGRNWRHRNELKRGVHKCKKLQELYDTDPALHFSGIPFLTKEEALSEEQRMIDMYKRNPFLLNVVTLNVRNTMASLFANGHKHSDETRKRMSVAKKGKPLSDEHRKKMSESAAKSVAVVIDGIEYSTMLEASERLGIAYDVVRRRLKSPKHPTWLRKPKEEN